MYQSVQFNKTILIQIQKRLWLLVGHLYLGVNALDNKPYDIRLIKGPPLSTLMHIHMERGRVSNVSRMEKITRIHPHKPMSLSVFSKAERENKHDYA